MIGWGHMTEATFPVSGLPLAVLFWPTGQPINGSTNVVTLWSTEPQGLRASMGLLPRFSGVSEIPGVGVADAVGQGDAVLPAKGADARDIHELARRAVGWKHRITMADGIRDAYAWYLANAAEARK